MDGWIGRAGVERGRETEGRPFSWLTRGERGSLMSLSRGAAGLEHYIRSFIRDELQLPLLFTRDEIEFYTVGIPSSPEGEYFTMINDLCRQHAPFFLPSPPLVHFSSLRTRYLRTRKWIHGDDDQATRVFYFSFLSLFLFRQFLPAKHHANETESTTASPVILFLG